MHVKYNSGQNIVSLSVIPPLPINLVNALYQLSASNFKSFQHPLTRDMLAS